ncbi:pretoxin [Paenibacillus lemnae]|uniref:Pretoxin n=2 Tax=Paenibacillus lemnae TaxID=1330551 RepID=A0A848MDP7_PAELE|nr:pretoxin [Paenibacillus lemnae]
MSKSASKGLSKAVNPCNCFTAGTQVLTDEGEKPIEEIEVGDKVLAKSEYDSNGELAYKEVTALYRNQRDDIIKLHVGEQIIETTDNHPFWVEGKGWIFADELRAGDKLQKADGSNLTIDKVEFIKLVEPVTVYNFTVADYHTYYVTDLGIWVHNTNCPFGKYEDAPYHGTTNNSVKNKAPNNGQNALNNSMSIGPNTDRRIAISNGEFVVLDKTSDGLYHGHVRSWSELTPTMQAILRKERLVDKKGRMK